MPLPQLVRQLLANYSQHSLTALLRHPMDPDAIGDDADPALLLLLRFQRLLVIHWCSSDQLLNDVVLIDYVGWLCHHSSDILTACRLRSTTDGADVINLLRRSVIGFILFICFFSKDFKELKNLEGIDLKFSFLKIHICFKFIFKF